MPENGLEVKQSKIYFVFCLIGSILIIAFCLGLFIFILYCLIRDNYENNAGEFFVTIFSLCYTAIAVCVFVAMLIYIVFVYKFQRDIFYDDKVIRKRRNKIIFELPYENIISVREGFESLFMELKSHIIESNGKKGTRNFYAHYSRADISRIKQIIAEKYNNVSFLV